MDKSYQLYSLIHKKDWSQVIDLLNQSDKLLDEDGLAVAGVVNIYLEYLKNNFNQSNSDPSKMCDFWKSADIINSKQRLDILNVLEALIGSNLYSDLSSALSESLPTAVRTHDEELITLFLKNGANTSKIDDEDDVNSFGLAIILENLETVKLFFHFFDNIVNKECGFGVNPLQLCMHRNMDICKLLLKNGASMVPVLSSSTHIIPMELFSFPIFNAVYAGNVFLATALLENGADVNQNFEDSRENPFHLVLKHGTLPLHLAVQRSDIEMIKTLINYGARLDEVSGRGHTPLGLAIMTHDDDGDKVADILLNAGCSQNKETIIFFFHRMYMPIFAASFVGKTGIVKRLLEESPSVLNSTASDGSTPLFMAAHGGHLELVKYLLSEGADPLFTSDHGNLIHAAVYSGNINIMDIVMKHGCDVDCVNQGGNTPLLLAVSQGNRAVCERLVTHGASLNVVDRFDETPLLRSVGNNTNVLRLLLQHGADCTITDASGESPLYKALVDKNKTVVHLLLFSGAKTSSEEEREKMAALLQGEVTQARSLLDICVLAVRAILISVAGGKSIENRVRLLPVSLPLKELLMLK